MCLEGCELSVFCSCGFVSAAMAHVFYDVVAVCCAVLVSCAVVCDALCSALLLQSALDGLEPLSLGLIKFRTWHLRIRKNMKSKKERPAGEDVWGGPAVLLAPGQVRPTPARIFPQRTRTNTNPIHRARPAGRPVGSACGFLSRSDAGQVRLEPPRTGAGEKRPSTAAISSTRIAIGCLFALREDSAGACPPRQPAVIDRLCQRVAAQTRRIPKAATNLAWHCLLLIRPLHLGTAASSG